MRNTHEPHLRRGSNCTRVSASNLTALKNKDTTDAYTYGTVCINCSGVERTLTLLDGDRRFSDGLACTSSGSTLLRAASKLGGVPVVLHGNLLYCIRAKQRGLMGIQ
jgi:hypothetical protein